MLKEGGRNRRRMLEECGINRRRMLKKRERSGDRSSVLLPQHNKVSIPAT